MELEGRVLGEEEDEALAYGACAAEDAYWRFGIRLRSFLFVLFCFGGYRLDVPHFLIGRGEAMVMEVDGDVRLFDALIAVEGEVEQGGEGSPMPI